MSDPNSTEAHDWAAARSSGDRRWWRDRRFVATVAVVVGMLGVLLAADRLTSSSAVCASCHELDVRVMAWEQSAHAATPCVACHAPAGPWYAYPRTLAARISLLVGDVYKHVSGRYADPVDERPAHAEPMPDAVCLQCHKADRKATSGFRIKIDHVEHAERNGSCVSCHVRTAHPEPAKGRALSLMAQCYTCHGKPEYPDASTACDDCHPAGYELVPASHKEAEWRRKHGGTVTIDEGQCELCHGQSFCDDCHGLEMPHPDDWAKGDEGHAVVAEQDREVCSQCHTEKPDLCSMCHHTYDPTRGTWVQQHFIEVERQGSDYCMECHLATYCVRCHVSWATSGGLTP